MKTLENVYYSKHGRAKNLNQKRSLQFEDKCSVKLKNAEVTSGKANRIGSTTVLKKKR